METNVLVIRKYGNRKLYNTESSSYVTLTGVADLVKTGRPVQVLDHATGSDVTTVVLANAIGAMMSKIDNSSYSELNTKLVETLVSLNGLVQARGV